MSQKTKTKPPICPYCNATSVCTSSKEVYTRWYGWLWLCPNYPACDSYVGCHKGTKKPLGGMANGELRRWKMLAHNAFDPLWRRLGWKRRAAYEWLANQVHVEFSKCHIGMFDVEQCQLVVQVCERYMEAVA